MVDAKMKNNVPNVKSRNIQKEMVVRNLTYIVMYLHEERVNWLDKVCSADAYITWNTKTSLEKEKPYTSRSNSFELICFSMMLRSGTITRQEGLPGKQPKARSSFPLLEL